MTSFIVQVVSNYRVEASTAKEAKAKYLRVPTSFTSEETFVSSVVGPIPDDCGGTEVEV